MTTSWIYLFVAGGLEIAATTLFRYTDGLSKLMPTIAFFAVGIASFYFLSKSIIGDGAIPLGTAYAVWTGIGAAGTALIGLGLYGEPAGALRVALLFLLIASIVGLKLVSTH
ncbi:MAG: multidrug efflux SMR transporter [Hyphomicrobiaceae bacterium]|nr:multidrug efflux SMR transporter [Hyphomicrobiaceae bacterium]